MPCSDGYSMRGSAPSGGPRKRGGRWAAAPSRGVLCRISSGTGPTLARSCTRAVAIQVGTRPLSTPETFAAAQALLARNRHARRTRVPKAAAALLYGRLFDCDGQLMEPIVLRGKAGRLYRYYVSPPVWRQSDGDTGDDAIRRVPAVAIEELLEQRLASIVRVQPGELDRDLIRDIVARAEIHASAVHVVLRARTLGMRSGQRPTIDSVRRTLQPGERVTTNHMTADCFGSSCP